MRAVSLSHIPHRLSQSAWIVGCYEPTKRSSSRWGGPLPVAETSAGYRDWGSLIEISRSILLNSRCFFPHSGIQRSALFLVQFCSLFSFSWKPMIWSYNQNYNYIKSHARNACKTADLQPTDIRNNTSTISYTRKEMAQAFSRLFFLLYAFFSKYIT